MVWRMSEKARKTEEQIPSFKCPNCKEGTIIIYKSTYDLNDGDKMLILRFECDKCEFTNNDIIPMTTRIEPGTMTLKITDEKDLRSKIYRSTTSMLEIPELELSVEPGPGAKFYFTNVEGVLDRFETAVSIFRRDIGDDDPETAEIDELLDDLKKALKGQLNFTLKITDLGGGSYIIPEDDSKYSFEPYAPEEANSE